MAFRKTNNRMGKRAFAVAVAFLLVLLATLPLIYPYLTSILAPSPGIVNVEVNPSSVPNLPIPPAALLGYANIIIESAQGGNFTRAQALTVYLNDLPPTVEHNLLTYLREITELISILKSAKDGLDALSLLVANGQSAQARALVSEINSALNDASTRLGTLYAALDRIAAIYNIDVSQQRARLDGLAAILAQFKQLLQTLKATLENLDTRIATRLMVNVTPNPVWINGTLHVNGLLEESNGMGLGGRVVELWLNASRVGQVSSGEAGDFTWTYEVNATRAGALALYARYTPTGNDMGTYRPTVSDTVIVPVNFYPVTLTALPTTSRVYVTEAFSIHGSLANLAQQPLTNETILLMVDGKPSGSTQTDTSGSYVFTSSFPQGTAAGTHSVWVEFNPASGVYEPNALAIGIQVYYIPSKLTVTSTAPTLTLSGQTLTLTGTVTVESKPSPQGWVTAFAGERELGRVPVAEGGTFQLPISIPLDLSGQNQVTILFSPKAPWILSDGTSIELNVMNSGLLSFASIGLVAAAVTLTTRTTEPTPKRRRRESEEPALEQLAAETAPASVTIQLARLEAIKDPRTCVKETYWESRRAILQALNETTPPNETHREAANRLNPKLGEAATPFSLLTLMFELAEYSKHEITVRAAYDAIHYLTLIAQTLNAQLTPKQFNRGPQR